MPVIYCKCGRTLLVQRLVDAVREWFWILDDEKDGKFTGQCYPCQKQEPLGTVSVGGSGFGMTVKATTGPALGQAPCQHYIKPGFAYCDCGMNKRVEIEIAIKGAK